VKRHGGAVLIVHRSVEALRFLRDALRTKGFEAKAIFNHFQAESALPRHEERGVLLIDARLLSADRRRGWESLLEQFPRLQLVAVGTPDDASVRGLVASRKGVLLEEGLDLLVLTQAVRQALAISAG
jgi:DNA-binding NtrC family response regulator